MSDGWDVIIVGAGIAGSAMAASLSRLGQRIHQPLRILLLERNISEPHRIVGELLQPGGVLALEAIGIPEALEGIGSVPVKGYGVINQGRNVHIPYPQGYEGRSFHHGRFVQSLRAVAGQSEGVCLLEATVTNLSQCPSSGRVNGVTIRDATNGEDKVCLGDLVIIADGCFSNLRSKVLGDISKRSSLKSHFVGLVLQDIQLPYPQHGTVVLIPDSGPVLLYQIEEHDTRILIDIRDPLPSDLKCHIKTNIVPYLPKNLQGPVILATEKDRLQKMPNTFLPPHIQGVRGGKEGCFLLGDAWNMRHPLTGGGMTVALSDVVLLTRLFERMIDSSHMRRPFQNWDRIAALLSKWHWARKPLSATINILSVALYDLFGANGEDLSILRSGCFKYFERGGKCTAEPVSLLSGIKSDPVMLFRHFFAVALYSMYMLFTHERTPASKASGKLASRRPGVEEYPGLILRSISVLWTACVVFVPLLWTEIRWW